MTNIKWFENLKVSLFNHYGKAPAKMLIHTGVIGWIMSSAAQIFAITINDKIPKEQKMFMIPQEAADAMINILSFYTITQSVTSLATKAVKSGKILPKNIRQYLTAIGLEKRIGKWDFDIPKHVKLPKNLDTKYNKFKNGTDVIATLIGSIVSCNIVTPLLRNVYASHRQQTNIAKMNNKPAQNALYNPQKPDDKKTGYIRTPLQTFKSNGSLRI